MRRIGDTKVKPAGWHHTEESKEKNRLAHLGRSGMTGERNPMKRIEVRKKNSLSHCHPCGPYSQARVLKAAGALVTHHRDFDHGNDFTENKRKMTRRDHNSLHRQSGRRSVVFVKNALEKGDVTKKFYEDFLAYINQEDQLLSEVQPVAEGITSETIN